MKEHYSHFYGMGGDGMSKGSLFCMGVYTLAPKRKNKVVFAQTCPWSVCSQSYWGN